MSKDKEVWGNLSLDGLTHEEIMRPDINRVISNRERAKDPVWLAKIQGIIAERFADEQFVEQHRARLAQTKQSEVWQRNHAAAMQELNSSDSYKQLMTEINRATAQTKEWRLAQRKSADSELRKQRLREEHSGDKHHAFKGAYIVTNNRSVYNERMGLAPGESMRLMPGDLKKYNANTSHVSKVCNGVMEHYLKCIWKREE